MEKKNYRKYVVSFIAIFILGIGALTLAWFTSTENAKVTYNTLAVDAKFNESGDESNSISLVPGDTIDKNISVTSNGSAPSFIRVKLDSNWQNIIDNNESSKANNIDYVYQEDDQGVSVVSETIEDGKWYEDGGYLYYIGIVTNEQELPLLDAIEFVGDKDVKTDTNYQNKTLSVDVNMELVQAKNNAYEQVWTQINNEQLKNKLESLSISLN